MTRNYEAQRLTWTAVPFYGRFRIDSRTGIQTGHRVLLIRWQGGYKVVLPSSLE